MATGPAFDDYRETARARGAMAFEVFVLNSTLVGAPEAAAAALPDHLAYVKSLESAGALMMAGPISDEAGAFVAGGMWVLKAADLAEATRLADGDPMHQKGVRQYTLRRWLINEGGMSLKLTFSTGPAGLL